MRHNRSDKDNMRRMTSCRPCIRDTGMKPASQMTSGMCHLIRRLTRWQIQARHLMSEDKSAGTHSAASLRFLWRTARPQPLGSSGCQTLRCILTKRLSQYLQKWPGHEGQGKTRK